MSKHQTQTDQIKEVQLLSAIQCVQWTSRQAALGGTVGIEVFTQFVGNGSNLEIELSDANGKTFGKSKEKISGNRFWAQIKVPKDAKQGFYATVKLPKHGLQMKSNPLILLPAVEITNLKWDKKDARRGDILKLTADIKGSQDGAEAEISIWEYDDDLAHDFISKFPVTVKNNKIEADWEYEYYEDTDGIATDRELEKGYNPPEYFFRVSLGGVQADSGILEFKDWLEISLKDKFGDPVPDADYVLKLADGTEKQGKLDKDGRARIEDIPPGSYWIHFPEHEDDL